MFVPVFVMLGMFASVSVSLWCLWGFHGVCTCVCDAGKCLRLFVCRYGVCGAFIVFVPVFVVLGVCLCVVVCRYGGACVAFIVFVMLVECLCVCLCVLMVFLALSLCL